MSVPHVQASARTSLVSLVEAHLTSLVRESVTVQRHCKRARIHLQSPDKDGEQESVIKRRLHAEDITMALQWRGSEKIYATGTVGSSSSDNKKVNLEDYLKSENDLRPPQEVGLTVHWLAVDGVQPDIPQNPTKQQHRVHRVEQEENEAEGAIQVAQLTERFLSEELQLYLKRVTTAIERGGKTPTTRQRLDAALTSLAKDSGLQELVPLLVNYVNINLFHYVATGDSEHCRNLVRMAHALLVNKNLHLELQMHILLPPLLTCVVAEKLSTRLWENHWILRNEAALTVVQGCNLFKEDYGNLKPQVLTELWKAVKAHQPLATQYGGFVGFTLFGPRSIKAFVLPVALEYWNQWEKKLEETNDLEQRLELQMCQQVVLDALGVFLGDNKDEAVFLGDNNDQAPGALWDQLEDTFGDRLVMQTNEQTQYAMCFV